MNKMHLRPSVAIFDKIFGLVHSSLIKVLSTNKFPCCIPNFLKVREVVSAGEGELAGG